MHIAIDLGVEYSYLTCWEPGQQLEEPCIQVKTYGLGPFDVGDEDGVWSQPALRDHLAHLHREYLLPSRRTIDSAALSVPGIWPLNARAALANTIEEIFGLDDGRIVPWPLAAAVGLNLRHPHRLLAGDILLIRTSPVGFDYALLNLSSLGGMILEKCFSGGKDLLERTLSAYGYLSPAGWLVDQVILCGDGAASVWQEQLRSLGGGFTVHSIHDMDFVAADGLLAAGCTMPEHLSQRFGMIYPFEFLLLSPGDDSSLIRQQKIPFDTANLDLDCWGRYPILELDWEDEEDLQSSGGQIHFQVYEVPLHNEPDRAGDLPLHRMVLEIDCPRNSLPPQLILQLDLQASVMSLGATTDPSPVLERELPLWQYDPSPGRDRLLAILEDQTPEADLVKDWHAHIADNLANPGGLAYHLQNSLFRLHALHRLWSGTPR